MKTKEIVMDKQKLTLALEYAISEAENPPLGNTKGYYDIFIDTLKEQGYEITNKEKWNDAKEIMKDFKGTKGEWYLGQEQNIVCDTIKKRYVDEMGYDDSENDGSLAQCWEDFHNNKIIPESECKANAKLMAASPDLLQVVQKLIHMSKNGYLIGWQDLTNQAEKAIDKAL